MWTPFIYVGILVFIFSGYLYVCVKEEKRGSRLWLAGFRDVLDRWLDKLFAYLEHLVRYVIKYVITLSWYYSLHAFLMIVLRSVAKVYYMIESVVINNRDRARQLRKEKRTTINHLTQIAEHKEEKKLTPLEMRKRKDQALKGH